MKRHLAAAAAALALGIAASPAQAAMVVYDPASYAKLIEQAKTALDQLREVKAQVQQGQALFDSLNEASNVGDIARVLSDPLLREVLPEFGDFAAGAAGDLEALGDIGRRAEAIRGANRLYTPGADEDWAADLEAAGDRAARDFALAEAVATAGAQRLAGLQTLQAAIDSAPHGRCSTCRPGRRPSRR